MKKFLITISPFCMMLFAFMWISWGLKGVLVFFGAATSVIVVGVLQAKWMMFVDKHVKD